MGIRHWGRGIGLLAAGIVVLGACGGLSPLGAWLILPAITPMISLPEARRTTVFPAFSNAVIRPQMAGACRVRYGDREIELRLQSTAAVRLGEDLKPTAGV